MNKKIWIGLATIIGSLGGYIGYKTMVVDNNFSTWRNIVPADAALVYQTNKPIKNWKLFSNSPMWLHFKHNKSLNTITENANYLDDLIKNNKNALSIIGDLPFIMSVHTISNNDFDFLYGIDLGKLSKFDVLKNILKKATQKAGYTHKVGIYQSFEYDEFYDKQNKETLYIGYFNNFLVCSFNLNIFKNCIKNHQSPVLGNNSQFVNIDNRTDNEGLLRTFINYENIAKFSQIFVQNLNGFDHILKQVEFSGLDGDLNNNQLILNGFTQLKDSTNGYINSIWEAGKNSLDAVEIMPTNTAFLTAINFNNFTDFYDKMLTNYTQKNNKKDEYTKNIKKVERYLGISIREDIMGWIGTEICVAQIKQHQIIGGKLNKVIAIKTKDLKAAEISLDKLLLKIKKRSPIKFKTANYNGYAIKYMHVKGLFKSMFGKMFEGIDKPYFTSINKHIVFCNNAEVLLKMIDDYEAKNVLANDDTFKENLSKFSSKSTLFTYLNLNAFFPNLKGILDKEDWANARKNSQYIQCFPFVAMQFTATDKGFYTRMQAKFDTSNMQDYTLKKTNNSKVEYSKTTDDKLTKIEEFIIKNINKNTRKEYYENGQLKLLAEMKNDLYHGRYIEYYENGMIKVKGKFKKGEKKGLWKNYAEDGEIVSKERFSWF